MYPDGVGQLVEGWSKNMAAGARYVRVSTMLLVVAWLSLCIQAPWYGPAVYTVVVAQLAWMTSRIGRFGVAALALFPIPLAAFIVVFLRSIFLTVARRRVTWKGRDLRPSA
jgi:4,4'-diaponeurosporenoate glycosyltransferase